jgi:hypothetical protein
MNKITKYFEDWRSKLEAQNRANPPHRIWKWINTALLILICYIVVRVK